MQSRHEKVEAALELLRCASSRRLSLKDALSIVCMVTKLSEEVLREAVKRGIIRREGREIVILAEPAKARCRRHRCDAVCRRCGRRIKLCHYLHTGGFELGPYGSECIRKIAHTLSRDSA